MSEESDKSVSTIGQAPTPIDSQTSGERKLSTAELASASNKQDAPSSAQPDGSKSDTEVESRPIAQPKTASSSSVTLFPEDTAADFRSRWDSIQSGFVDEPRTAVEQADGLVADMMKRLAEAFAKERNDLEGQWQRGEDISTEDLRVALQRYRSFFDRLLSV